MSGWDERKDMEWVDGRKDMGWVDEIRERIWYEWMGWKKGYGMKG